MKSLLQYIDEGLLKGMEDTLDDGQADLDAVAIQDIEKKLLDQNLYYIHNTNKNRPDFEIKKVRGKWAATVNGNLTVYGMDERITDGSFSFDVIKGDFIISCGWDNKTFRSLQYGPKEVQGHMMTYWGENFKSLQYCPKTVHGDFFINSGGLETLKYFPDFVHGHVRIADCMQLRDFTPSHIHKCHIDKSVKVIYNGAKTTEAVAQNILKRWNIGNLKISQFDYNVNDYRGRI